MNALLLSASREGNTSYLSHALPFVESFTNCNSSAAPATMIFIPYAGVTVSYDEYTDMVAQALATLNIKVIGIHNFENPSEAIASADIIAVGGGNTFELLNQLYQKDLISVIRDKVNSGTKYIGWSAGSNIAGASIRTTNDMPIVQPKSFDALSLVPFQLNPHYTEYQAPGHNGETREMRIQEFMVLNPDMPVVGIQEGSALLLANNSLQLVGNKVGYLFLNGKKTELASNEDLSRLL